MTVFLPWASRQSNSPEELDTQSGSPIELRDRTLPRWTWQRPPWMECSLMAGMGVVPPGMALPHCIYHAKERAAMPHAKVTPLPTDCSSQGHCPRKTICMRSAGFYRWRNSRSGQRCFLWMVSSGIWHPLMLMPRPVNGGPVQWAGPMVVEGWSLWGYTQAGPNPGAEHATVPLMGLTPCLKPSHHHQKPAGESSTAQQHCGCSTMCPSQSLSTGPSQSWDHFHTSPRVKGWTPIHSLVRHGPSEATNIRWPWGSSSTRCSQPMHRHSYSRGRQQ